MKDKKKLEHLAIILDGNGRWAEKRSLSRSLGHKEGSENVVDIALYAKKRGIKYLTLYAFSTENWKRPKIEVNYLMKLLAKFIKDKTNLLMENDVKLNIIGDISKLPDKTIKSCLDVCKLTENNKSLVLNMAINYGGRSELVKAFKDMAKDGLDFNNIDENTISSYLYTKNMPDPDLLIRTGGDLRISNFLIYQLAYTEFYFTKTLWPDFKYKDLDEAIDSYLGRDRRFGGLNEPS
ncbi:isoprenyl transferase [Anaerococcus sp. AGMB00486]|nr:MULTISPECIES: isoprenyl transferase [Anaerococcus]MDY3005929.1 isoprenyl transferase [Anaerococcus porci]NVF10945.1 isoprenyl transferase [Anaerococcus faecalis]